MADISVLMAVYNAMPYLPAAVESICAQTYRDWKMVIVNDGSTDGTADFLAQLTDPRIQVIAQANRGLGPALNHGLEYCDAEFTARMDGDDISHPTRFAEQAAFLRAHPAVGLVGTQIEHIGTTTRTGMRSSMATEHDKILADIRAAKNQMYHPTIMCRTNVLKRIGGYWAHPRGEEWDLFLRMGEQAELANLDQVLLTYRVLNSSMTGSGVAKMRSWVEYACDCDRRRRAGEAAIAYADFVQQRQSEALWRRVGRGCQMHARQQYRLALGEMLSDRRVRGLLRMAYAAQWSPTLLWGRVARTIKLRARRDNSSATSNNTQLSMQDA